MSNHYFKLDNIEMHCADSWLHIECAGLMNSIQINNPYRSKKLITFLENASPKEDEAYFKINKLDISLCKNEDDMYELCFDSGAGDCVTRTILFFENKEQLTKFIEWFKANCKKD